MAFMFVDRQHILCSFELVFAVFDTVGEGDEQLPAAAIGNIVFIERHDDVLAFESEAAQCRALLGDGRLIPAEYEMILLSCPW